MASLSAAGWALIQFRIFAGEAGSVAASGDKESEHVKTAFATSRLIVSVGWCTYPLDYSFGNLWGNMNDDSLNWVYNSPTSRVFWLRFGRSSIVVIFAGEAGNVAASGDRGSEYVKTSSDSAVNVCWNIYPLGYFSGTCWAA